MSTEKVPKEEEEKGKKGKKEKDIFPPKREEEGIQVFRLNDELAEFEELELDSDLELYELLNSEDILFFVNPAIFRSYIWTGSKTSVRMKFIAAQKATAVRDEIGPAIKVSTLEEDEENKVFKIMVGLEKEEEVEEEEIQTGPAYEGKAEDEVLLEHLTLEKIVLLLEKNGCPEGYKREMVIDGNNIYGYHESYIEYMGEIIKERKLYPLEKSIPDGPYMAEGLIPRILMSYNKIIVIELLRKLTQKEIEKRQSIKRKISSFKTTITGETLFALNKIKED